MNCFEWFSNTLQFLGAVPTAEHKEYLGHTALNKKESNSRMLNAQGILNSRQLIFLIAHLLNNNFPAE